MRKNRDLNEKCRELLKQAKIGNRTAKKKLARIIHERSVFVNNASRRWGGTQG